MVSAPSVLFAVMVPPCASTAFWVTTRPRPAPGMIPTLEARQKGWKRWSGSRDGVVVVAFSMAPTVPVVHNDT